MVLDASGLTAAQIKELKAMLETKLASLTAEVKELENTLTEEENDDKGAPDEVDRSSFEEEMQRTQLVLDGKKALQYEVSDAIQRINENNYGVCEETEEPIGFKRLQAQPWTRLSLDAQRDLEQRRKNRALNTGSAAFPSAYGTDDGSDE